MRMRFELSKFIQLKCSLKGIIHKWWKPLKSWISIEYWF
jgi:hypothetical protein